MSPNLGHRLLVLVLLGFGGIVVPVQAQSGAESGILIVKVPTAHLMSGTATVAEVSSGQRLPFTRRSGDWYLVEFQKEGATYRGWIHRDDVVESRVAPPVPPAPPATRGLQGWGEVVDPDGDCSIQEKEGTLHIELPAGKHDLSHEAKLFNSPRVMQEVEGDFVAQVRVTADLDTGVPAPTFFYNGAGLLVWESPQQYLRLERNLLRGASTAKLIRYIAPGYARNGKWINGQKTWENEFFQGRSTWLRIERSGDRFATSVSHDGSDWMTTSVLKTEFPDKVQVGVLAGTRSPRGFAAEFTDFTLTRGQPHPIAATSSIPVEGWGNLIDPDEDCQVRLAPDHLTLRVPAGLHDLWYGEKDPARRYNAPRLLQAVEGDFVMRIRVTADWKLGDKLPNGRNFSSAGLLIWDSPNQYFRHERNLYIPPSSPDNVYCYVPPLYDRDGTRLTTWKAVEHDYFKGDSTWLMLQRTGTQIHTWISHDGKQWIHTGTQTSHFPDKIQAGVYALNASGRELAVSFAEFSLQATPVSADRRSQ